MACIIKGKDKFTAHKCRHPRPHKEVDGTPTRSRLVVTRSDRYAVAQVINDTIDYTLASALDIEATLVREVGTKTEKARKIGALAAERAKVVGTTAVVFDRGGNKYFGHVAAVVEAAREGGLEL